PRARPRSTLFPYTTLFRSSPFRLYFPVGIQRPPHSHHKKPVRTCSPEVSLAYLASQANSASRSLLEGKTHRTSSRRFSTVASSSDRKSTRLNSSHVASSYA